MSSTAGLQCDCSFTIPITHLTRDQVQSVFLGSLDCLRSTVPPRRKVALLLSWKEHDLARLDVAKGGLSRILESLYGFEVHKMDIPNAHPDAALRQTIKNVTTGRGAGDLVIIHYLGHGGICDGDCWWSSTGRRQCQSLNWTKLYCECLCAIEADLLLLLDCCHAGSAVRGDHRGCKELMAASAAGTVAQATKFTTVLTQELASLALTGKPFSTARLHYEMLKRRNHNMGSQPFYASLSNNAWSHPIMLHPKPANSVSATDRASHSLLSQPCKVLLSMQLTATASPFEFAEWSTLLASLDSRNEIRASGSTPISREDSSGRM